MDWTIWDNYRLATVRRQKRNNNKEISFLGLTFVFPIRIKQNKNPYMGERGGEVGVGGKDEWEGDGKGGGRGRKRERWREGGGEGKGRGERGEVEGEGRVRDERKERGGEVKGRGGGGREREDGGGGGLLCIPLFSTLLCLRLLSWLLR